MPRKKTSTSAGVWKTYSSADEALRAIQDYFTRCDDKNVGYGGEATLANAIRVPLSTLRSWFDGEAGEDYKAAAQWGYQQIAAYFETDKDCKYDKVYSKRAAEMMKQDRFQGYQKKDDTGVTVNVVWGGNVEASDFD